MTRRRLSPEDETLWSAVAATVAPIVKRKTEAKAKAGKDPADAPPAALRAVVARAAPKKTGAQMPAASPLVAGDPRLDRKARRGRMRASRTLDLHGMTQDEAFVSIRHFLESAAADGVVCVKIITGKGGPPSASASSQRGVLRRRFLEWIEAPSLRPLIARAAPAEARTATPGAYYLFLKAPQGGARKRAI